MRIPSWLALVLLLATGACAPGAEPRPSILLVVVDTLRADAVSAAGAVADTTPHLDALASEGLLYTRAFAPAPWTLPSHATILTGASLARHGVGTGGRMALPADVVTLAERLAGEGYLAAAFSENPLVSPAFGFGRGFSSFAVESVAQKLAARRGEAPPEERFDVVGRVAAWAARADPGRPWFVFVNLFDPHDPFEVRARNEFLPPGVDAAQADRVQRVDDTWVAQSPGICGRIPPDDDLAILRGLYLGDVAAADAKLGAITRILDEARGGPLVHVVTSDHGEHLGEHRLLGHEFSLRNVLLHVPLVVRGLPDVAPARVEAPVALRDLVPSILVWSGSALPAGLAGRPLPTEPGAPAPQRALLAVFADETPQAPETIAGAARPSDSARQAKRAGCHAADRVHGHIAALTRYPFKLIWYERYAPQLYDLSWDAGERSDLAPHHPQQVAALREELEQALAGLELEASDAEPAPGVSPEALRALRGLGYVE